MTKTFLSFSTATIASLTFGLSGLAGCSSSDNTPATGDASSGGQTGSGGSQMGTGGASTSGGASSSGGAAGAASCTVAIGTTCDGPEDCPSGQRCCGKYQQQYVEIGCFDSCAAQQGDAGFTMGGALWFELCHPSDTCETSGAMCGTSMYLPGSLSRCLPPNFAGMVMSGTPDATLGHDRNAVNCGKAVCGASEQCCIRQPLEPYCAPKTATCDCNPPDAGAPKADGGNSKDAGKPPDGGAGGTSPKDAASDASDASAKD